MKRKRTLNNVKLGSFVLAGVLFLVFSLYMIGRNRSLFGDTFAISARFRNVNGLVAGNNVRFSGIDVGTVKSVAVENDTSIFVTMVVSRKMQPYIKTNALAAIGTDGLVGNKLVNISAGRGAALPVEEGQVISSVIPVETDEMLRTLQTTNGNIAVITENLKEVAVRLNGSSTLWNILADTTMAKNLKSAASHLNNAGANTEIVTGDARKLVGALANGNGLVKSVFTDTVLRNALTESVRDLQRTGKALTATSSRLSEITEAVQDSKGSIGVLLSDTITSLKLKQAIANIEQGSGRFNENMEALKGNFLLRKYFRKQKRQQKDK
jgi:phospholipid/cholesterol/gamma-HCH transport system substrate-binding protein